MHLPRLREALRWAGADFVVREKCLVAVWLAEIGCEQEVEMEINFCEIREIRGKKSRMMRGK